MSSYFNLTLDTSGPASPSIIIEGGAAYTSVQLVSCAISTSDGDTTGYQMKIWEMLIRLMIPIYSRQKAHRSGSRLTQRSKLSFLQVMVRKHCT